MARLQYAECKETEMLGSGLNRASTCRRVACVLLSVLPAFAAPWSRVVVPIRVVDLTHSAHGGADINADIKAANLLLQEASIELYEPESFRPSVDRQKLCVCSAEDIKRLAASAPAGIPGVTVFYVHSIGSKDLRAIASGLSDRGSASVFLSTTVGEGHMGDALAHEIGHLFGLSDVLDKENLMSAVRSRLVIERAKSRHSILTSAQVAALHQEATAFLKTIGAKPRATVTARVSRPTALESSTTVSQPGSIQGDPKETPRCESVAAAPPSTQRRKLGIYRDGLWSVAVNGSNQWDGAAAGDQTFNAMFIRDELTLFDSYAARSLLGEVTDSSATKSARARAGWFHLNALPALDTRIYMRPVARRSFPLNDRRFMGPVSAGFLPDLRRYPLSHDARLTLVAPRKIQISRTAPLLVTLVGEPGCRCSLRLDSPAFDVSPNEMISSDFNEGEVHVDWLITPKKTGEHELMLRANVICGPSKDQSSGPDWTRSSTIHIRISVVNDLGFTAHQTALLYAFVATLGAISLICGLPFVRLLFKAPPHASG
jgi:hypothetical protein